MKSFITIVFIIIYFSFSFATANTNISFIDIDKVLSSSKPALILINQLKKIDKKNIEKLNKIEKLLQDRESKIISQKNIISKDILNEEIKKLKVDIKKYNENRKKIITNFNDVKLSNTNKLIQLINPIIKNYADKNSIDIILQKKNIVMGKNESDITDKIIDIVNINIKNFKINE
jgi:outer membrane protein